MKYFIVDMLIIIVLTITALLVVLAPSVTFVYVSSCKKAKVYNLQHGTGYSCSDFFWAGEQINSQTQTININSK